MGKWLDRIKKADKVVFGEGPLKKEQVPPLFREKKKTKGRVSENDYSRF